MVALLHPTVRERIAFVQAWNGQKHRDYCANMQNGRLVVQVSTPGVPVVFKVYDDEMHFSGSILSMQNVQTGTMTIETSKRWSGRVCWGVGPTP